MTAEARLSREEIIGLALAVAAHVVLVAALLVQVRLANAPLAPPERITVSLATDVSLENTAPDPSANPAAAFAPEIAELPEPEAFVVPTPDQPAAQPVPPRPQPTRAVQPRPTASPSPRPTTRPTPALTPRATPRATPSPAATRAATGSRIGDDFLPGRSNADGDRGSPAATFGPTEQAALGSAITRALRPNWSAPSGLDAEKLVTVVAWRLNRDGSLRGQPSCIRQTGVTDSNRPQAQLHCERAIRAIQLANFSSLPEQFYSRWDDLEWDFDRRL